MSPHSWLAVVQSEDGSEECEVVTFAGLGYFTDAFLAGATIELTNGQRITLLEPTEKAA